MAEVLQAFFGIQNLAVRWSVSKDTIVRAIKRGDLQTLSICGRRLVPLAEVQRVEKTGLGNGRRKAKKAS